jgi:hypothetical protein
VFVHRHFAQTGRVPADLALPVALHDVPSQANDGGTNVVVYVDRLKDGNSVVVNDPDGRLPRDQSSWKR